MRAVLSVRAGEPYADRIRERARAVRIVLRVRSSTPWAPYEVPIATRAAPWPGSRSTQIARAWVMTAALPGIVKRSCIS